MTDTYQQQLDTKVAALGRALASFDAPPLAIYPSTASGYRMRCEFRIWHDDAKADYIMFEKGGRGRYTVKQFAPAAPAIQALMPKLIAYINAHDTVARRLFRVDFLCTLSGESMITLVYHRKLDEQWQAAARDMHHAWGVHIIGRSKGQKIVIGNDHLSETLSVLGATYKYRQIEGSFTQPNARVNEQMIGWACERAEALDGDLLELYCGNGNFTVPLARRFGRVLATEVSKTSIAALQWAINANNANNIEHARLSAQEMTLALDKVRPFRRLAHIDLDSYKFSTIFVDPPRAGVDAETMALVQRFEQVLYVSCNPLTLVENLETLKPTHRIVAAAAFDQFPFTEHLEAAVLLQRRSLK